MVRIRGLEPPWSCPHTDLNRTRLPIPPYPQNKKWWMGMDSFFAHRQICLLTPLRKSPESKNPARKTHRRCVFFSGFESYLLPNPILPTRGGIGFGGRGWIRTIVVCDNGFTVRSLWPLGNPSIIWLYLELVMGLEPATC